MKLPEFFSNYGYWNWKLNGWLKRVDKSWRERYKRFEKIIQNVARRKRERNGVRWHVGCDFCFSRDWDDRNCLADSFGLQRYTCVGADGSWLILFQLQVGYVFPKNFWYLNSGFITLSLTRTPQNTYIKVNPYYTI